MTIVKRSNSPYWYVQFQIDQKTFIRSTKTTDRKVAERMEAKFRSEAHQELVLGTKKSITVAAALDAYLKSRQDTPNYRNLISKRRTLLRFFKSTTLAIRVTNSDLENFKLARLDDGVTTQTIKHGLNLLLAAFRHAKRLGYEVPDLQPPSLRLSPGRLRYLSFDEERRLLSELEPGRSSNGLAACEERSEALSQALQDNHDLVVLLLDTGARYSEVAGLLWDHIDLEDGSIKLWRSKVQNESVLFLSKRAAELLQRRKRASTTPYVFTNKNGQARGYSVIALRKAFDRAGLHDCTIHTLRHTHASRLIQHGMSVYEVRSILGHSDIRTTMRYAHLEQRSVTSKARDVVDQWQK
ncbi:tyrosine-type recombinase/integrase [Devosia naphthalenivorans]|uniref:tyrosine-type recombinase/integrase n=1 Tax=Devosia naphthalenivorans TaxID=2082392 RepID=UPI000D3D9114|nr:site-specific integrase [Devosia naphthalenivorans]